MSIEKFTQGEWKVVNIGLTGDIFDVQFGDDGECVAEDVHTEADANLIAAAPKMYKTLAEISTMLLFKEKTQEQKDLKEHIDILLAEARGEHV